MPFAVSSSTSSKPFSFRKILTTAVGAMAAMERVGAMPVADSNGELVVQHVPRANDATLKLTLPSPSATVTIPAGTSTTSGASKAQKTKLADSSVEPAFNVHGVDATMKTSSNFTLYPDGDPSPHDVDQTVLGDCYFDAIMAAIAQQGSKAVKSIFSDGSKNVYKLKMYDPAGNAVNVEVTDALPYNTDDQLIAASGPSDDGNWASLAEKAYAKYNDVFQTVSNETGYAGIADGGDPGEVLRAFTGKPVVYDWHSSYVTSGERSAFAAELQTALKNGEPVAVASNLTNTLPSGAQIIGSHAYTIMQVDKTDGDWFIDIRNPWGIVGNVNGSSHDTDDGVLRMGFGDYVDMLILTYYPNGSITDADKSDTYTPPKGGSVIDGGDKGLAASGASRSRTLSWAALAGAVVFAARAL